MTRGQIKMQINRRILIPKSNKREDKYEKVDKLQINNIVELGKKKYFVKSLKYLSLPKYKITRDELAFIKLIKLYYGDGDYSIKIWGKGKNRGFRRFWDGLISKDKFQRRKEANMVKDEQMVSIFERQSNALDTESYIGRYMKTKRPGIWHNL